MKTVVQTFMSVKTVENFRERCNNENSSSNIMKTIVQSFMSAKTVDNIRTSVVCNLKYE